MPLRSILRQSWARIGDRMEATLGLSLALWGPLEGHITGSSIGPCVPRIRLETFRGTRSRASEPHQMVSEVPLKSVRVVMRSSGDSVYMV